LFGSFVDSKLGRVDRARKKRESDTTPALPSDAALPASESGEENPEKKDEDKRTKHGLGRNRIG
jgi:hypothetical protein